MKCRYCGTIIPDGVLRCSKCGNEVRIVPDYNPLDDMLTAHIRGAISDDYDYYGANVNDYQKNISSRNGRASGSRGVSNNRTSANGRTSANNKNSANRMTPEERREGDDRLRRDGHSKGRKEED